MNFPWMARPFFRSEALRAGFFFAALAAVFWFSFLLQGGALFSDTLLRHVYPNFAFTRDALRAFHFPFWNPHLFSGVPFSSNWQSAVFYPPTYLCLWLDFPRWLPVLVWFHTALAGWFVFRLGRLLGLSLESSGLAGVLYAFNGWFVGHHALLPHMQACAWAPGIVYYLWRAREEEGARPVLLAAVCVAFHILSGHPQFAVYAGLLTVMAAAGGGPRAWRGAATAWLLGLGLSAPQWLPSVPFLLMSPRGAGMAGDAAMMYALEPVEGILMLILPLWNRFFTLGSGDAHVVGFYAGLPALALALAALIGPGRRRWLAFAAFAAAGALLAVAPHVPWVGEFWGSLPFTRTFRFPAQSLFMAAFGAALLAAAGLERVTAGKRWRRALLAVVCVDLWLFARGAVEVLPAALYTASPPAARFLRQQNAGQRVMMAPHARFQGRSGGDKASAWMAYKDSLLPNLAMAEGLLDVDGYEEARFLRYDQVLNDMNSSPASPWISGFSVRYILALRKVPGLKEIFRSDVLVFENPGAFPRAFVTALLPAADPLVPQGPDGSGGARLEGRGPNRLRIQTESRGPGFLVVTDAWAPGWRARVNGVPAAIHRVNVMQRAVAVGDGPSVVEMVYEPPLLRAAAATALGTLAAILAWTILRRRKKR